MGQPHRVGVIGLGVISGVYLDTLRDSPNVQIAVVADIDAARAEAVAASIAGARAATVEQLLTGSDCDTVLNLTIPAAHAEIALASIAAGKAVYGEKPLAVTFADGVRIADAAARAGVSYGSAPDTVLGTGTQTARSAVERGLIGQPVGASATLVTSGPESWHPNPDFYYRRGGGPLMDMGPYYLSALVQVLGPIDSVVAMSNRTRPTRVIGAGPRAGERIPVDIDTHVSALLRHRNGAVSTLTTTFDGANTTAAPIEIHGEDGTLQLPDPNLFDGQCRVVTPGGDWTELPVDAGFEDGSRGVGLLDFLAAGPHRAARAGGQLALHVLEAMDLILASTATGQTLTLTTPMNPPTAVPLTTRRDWLQDLS